MAGRVDQVEPVGPAVLGRVVEPDGPGLDRDPLLALEVHRVEDLAVHLPRVDGVGELEQAVRQGRLAVVDVGDDGEVAQATDCIMRLSGVGAHTDEDDAKGPQPWADRSPTCGSHPSATSPSDISARDPGARGPRPGRARHGDDGDALVMLSRLGRVRPREVRRAKRAGYLRLVEAVESGECSAVYSYKPVAPRSIGRRARRGSSTCATQHEMPVRLVVGRGGHVHGVTAGCLSRTSSARSPSSRPMSRPSGSSRCTRPSEPRRTSRGTRPAWTRSAPPAG